MRRRSTSPAKRRKSARARRPADEQVLETQAHLIAEEELPVAIEEAELPPPPAESAEAGLAEPAATEAQEAPEGGALVAFDPLARYLAEIRRFPLLSREEEIEIAKHYQETQDPADAFRLVTANLRLVVKIANEFARASRNLLDLIQEGNIGMMEAVKHFNPYRGIRFPSYAVWWVRAYIIRFLMNNWRLVKVGTTQAQRKLFFNLKKESEPL